MRHQGFPRRHSEGRILQGRRPAVMLRWRDGGWNPARPPARLGRIALRQHMVKDDFYGLLLPSEDHSTALKAFQYLASSIGSSAAGDFRGGNSREYHHGDAIRSARGAPE